MSKGTTGFHTLAPKINPPWLGSGVPVCFALSTRDIHSGLFCPSRDAPL